MSLTDMQVWSTVHDDSSADFTITIADDDHKFSVSGADDGDHGVVVYEETLSWRGEIRVSEPDEDVWKMLMQSDEMTQYLEQSNLKGVQRKR